MSISTVTRRNPDGSVTVQKFDDSSGKNRLVSETRDGKSVARIFIEPTSSGKGIRRSRGGSDITSGKDMRLALTQQKTQEAVNKALQGSNEALRVVTDVKTGQMSTKQAEGRIKDILSRRKNIERIYNISQDVRLRGVNPVLQSVSVPTVQEIEAYIKSLKIPEKQLGEVLRIKAESKSALERVNEKGAKIDKETERILNELEKGGVNKVFNFAVSKLDYKGGKLVDLAKSLKFEREQGVKLISEEPELLFAYGYLLKTGSLGVKTLQSMINLISESIIRGSGLILKLNNRDFRNALKTEIIIPISKQVEFDKRKKQVFELIKNSPKTVKAVLKGFKVKDVEKAYNLLKKASSNLAKGTVSTVKSFAKKDVLREITPFINPVSKSGWAKVREGNIKDLTLTENASVVSDATLIFSVLGRVGVRVLNKISKPFIKKFAGEKLTKFLTVPSNVAKISKISTYNLIKSVADDVTFANRLYEASKKAYNVDTSLLKSVAKNTGLKNDKELLGIYNGFIAKELKDGKLNWRDYANFMGITTGSKSQVVKGQNAFIKWLRDNGYKRNQIDRILANLELYRRSEIIGVLGGLTRLEVSSDVLAGKLIKAGLGKRSAISVAVLREGLSTVVVESQLKGVEYTPAETFLGVVMGVPYSLWASKQGLKTVKLKPREVKRGIEKIANNVVKNLFPNKINRYNERLIRQVARSNKVRLKPGEVSKIISGMSKAEKKRGAREFVSGIILDNRRKKKFEPKLIQKTKGNILKDPIVNFFDPYEFLGDLTQDLGEGVVKLLNRLSDKVLGFKLFVRGKRVKRAIKKKLKVKPKVKSKVKSKVSSRVMTKTKGKSRVVSRVSSKQRVKIKPTSKTKLTTKLKTRPKPKVKPKPKPKPKTKVKPKPKPKTRVKVIFTQIPWLDLKELPIAFTLFAVDNKGGLIRQKVKGSFAQIVNKGIGLTNKNKRVKGFVVKRVGVLKSKPKTKVLSSNIKTFNVIRSKDSIRFTKKKMRK